MREKWEREREGVFKTNGMAKGWRSLSRDLLEDHALPRRQLGKRVTLQTRSTKTEMPIQTKKVKPNESCS